jgi:salicylate hydroxylase
MDSPLSSSPLPSTFKQLKVAVIGGGIGGLAAAVALRRAGHIGSLSRRLTTGGVSDNLLCISVEIFERRGVDVEVGASISCPANGKSRA